jgi:hypothetical protein
VRAHSESSISAPSFGMQLARHRAIPAPPSVIVLQESPLEGLRKRWRAS